MPCAYCPNVAVTTIPVADGTTGRVCGRHAEEFWRGVVRAGAGLARFRRAIEEQERDGEASKAA